jgi:hypothetical protein
MFRGRSLSSKILYNFVSKDSTLFNRSWKAVIIHSGILSVFRKLVFQNSRYLWLGSHVLKSMTH